MTGGPSYAAGLELAGASPISDEERERAQQEQERRHREAARLIAGSARDREDFYWLCDAADIPVDREFLAEVRALPRADAA